MATRSAKPVRRDVVSTRLHLGQEASPLLWFHAELRAFGILAVAYPHLVRPCGHFHAGAVVAFARPPPEAVRRGGIHMDSSPSCSSRPCRHAHAAGRCAAAVKVALRRDGRSAGVRVGPRFALFRYRGLRGSLTCCSPWEPLSLTASRSSDGNSLWQRPLARPEGNRQRKIPMAIANLWLPVTAEGVRIWHKPQRGGWTSRFPEGGDANRGLVLRPLLKCAAGPMLAHRPRADDHPTCLLSKGMIPCTLTTRTCALLPSRGYGCASSPSSGGWARRHSPKSTRSRGCSAGRSGAPGTPTRTVTRGSTLSLPAGSVRRRGGARPACRAVAAGGPDG